MVYEAQLANLMDDDDSDDDTLVRRVPARDESETVALPVNWDRHFWATPESHPLCVSWKNAERSAMTQRILRTGTVPTRAWRSPRSSWKAKAGALAMAGFFVSAVAVIAVAS
jgi:hypothetical protein